MRKERQMFHLYRRFLWYFQSWLLEHADCYIFFKNRTETLIRSFLLFNLLGCKWDAHKFLKVRVKYWYFVGNKRKGRISKRMFQKNKEPQIFRKTNISYPPDTHTYVRPNCLFNLVFLYKCHFEKRTSCYSSFLWC